MSVKSVLVRYDPNDPPVLTELVHAFTAGNVDVKFAAVKKGQEGIETTLVPIGDLLRGDIPSARFLARFDSSLNLNGADASQASQIDEWIFFAQALHTVDPSPKAVSERLQPVNLHLALRTFLVDPHLTVADLILFIALKNLGKKNANALKVLNQLTNINRWFLFLLKQAGVQKVVAKYYPDAAVQAAKPKEKKEKKEGLNLGHAAGYMELENVAEFETVVTRFPPEPSGYLHIGHAKAAFLNYYYAQKYNGRLIIRFDDTNPRKEKDEYAENILKDLETLGIPGTDKVTYTSDYFEPIEKLAEKLIRDGNGYIDNADAEEISKSRMEGYTTPARDNTIEKNLALWKEMLNGTPEGTKCVLRAKIETEHGPMKSPNKVLRDPALARVILDIPHPRQKNKFKVYPLYDFACPIVDSIEGVSHALRSNEYHDRNPLYYWVLEKLGLRKVYIEDYSRLAFTNTVLSKRKLQRIVDLKKVSGWTDPSFPTVQGLLRRGLTVEALKAFVISQGASKAVNLMDPDKLWAINRQVLDPKVGRYTGISKVNTVVRLSNGPATSEIRNVPKHKKNPELGDKFVSYGSEILIERDDANQVKAGEEVTLMDWGNAIFKTLHRDDSGQVIAIDAELHLEGSVKNTSKKLTWLDKAADNVEIVIKDYGNLITVPKVLPEQEFDAFISSQIEYRSEILGDLNLRNLPEGTSVQLERRGYFRFDKPYFRVGEPIELVAIPEGRKKNLAGKAN